VNYKIHTTSPIRRGALVALLVVLCCGSTLAQRDSGVVELAEARTALGAAIAKNAELHKRLKELERTNSSLSHSLAAANAESTQYREAYNGLRLQTEALGIDAVRKGAQGVSERLMKSAKDNGLLKIERDRLADALVRLSESVMAYRQSAVSSNVESELALEKVLEECAQALRGNSEEPEPEAKSIARGGRVVDIPRNLGIILVDLGEKSGVNIGMPFEISRKDRPIGNGYVVATRPYVSAVVVDKLSRESDKITVGDSVRLSTQSNF